MILIFLDIWCLRCHTSKYKVELKIEFEIVSTSSWPLGDTP